MRLAEHVVAPGQDPIHTTSSGICVAARLFCSHGRLRRTVFAGFSRPARASAGEIRPMFSSPIHWSLVRAPHLWIRGVGGRAECSCRTRTGVPRPPWRFPLQPIGPGRAEFVACGGDDTRSTAVEQWDAVGAWGAAMRRPCGGLSRSHGPRPSHGLRPSHVLRLSHVWRLIGGGGPVGSVDMGRGGPMGCGGPAG